MTAKLKLLSRQTNRALIWTAPRELSIWSDCAAARAQDPHYPTLRASIAIARVLSSRGGDASIHNPVFVWACRDILSQTSASCEQRRRGVAGVHRSSSASFRIERLKETSWREQTGAPVVRRHLCRREEHNDIGAETAIEGA